MENKKALVVFSGGQDSTTCLYIAKKNYEEVHALTFDYGQRHSIEILAAEKICEVAGVLQKVIKLDVLKILNDSALVDETMDISQEHRKKGLPASYVPNRNALLFTIAHAYAQKIGAEAIYTGICQTDFSGYPDCREGFIETLEVALNNGADPCEIKFRYPLMHRTKAETFKIAEDLGCLPIVLEHSNTCYEGKYNMVNEWGRGCGECPACKIRKRGWEEYKNL